MIFCVKLGLVVGLTIVSLELNAADWPPNLKVVLEQTKPLDHPRAGRLPLFVLPITNSLTGRPDVETESALGQLAERGIGYTVDWHPRHFRESLAEGLRIAKLQKKLGQPVAVNANACLVAFHDGSPGTLHIDGQGKTFADTSLGGRLGCPFALEQRVPAIKEQVAQFLRAYKAAGVDVDFVFADWEIDGPIEWNESWDVCKACKRCRESLPGIDDFRVFQRRLRAIRSEIQRIAFGDNVTEHFPEALVSNYGTYPHGGHRYWYDYFEKETKDTPVLRDQKARYREWAHEFSGTGYTFAMPVVYTWYPTFDWYDYADPDYRWFYNMLLVGSNAGRHTPPHTPIIPFVHWTTTAPPKQVEPHVRQMSPDAYQELLWHLLLRGHDTFFLWCLSSELAEEVRLVHEVYAASLAHAGFLNRGTPVRFDVDKNMTDVVSGLRLGKRVLVRRTPFGAESQGVRSLRLSAHETVSVPAEPGLSIQEVETTSRPNGLIYQNGKPLFPIGFYDVPADRAGIEEMAHAGVNLVRCGNRDSLDRARAAGMMGWVPLGIQQGATEGLRKQIQSVVDHPALAVWEGPDEIIWTFTAYSFLKERAGFTRDDWNDQKQIAVDYSEQEAAKIIPAMREGVQLVRDLDTRQRPFWVNEAADSDVRFARDYMRFIDVTGCDYYAVRKAGTDLQSIGRLVDRWHAIGRRKPVWMVLQAFSWHALKPERGRLYPSFEQSRFMAYDAIVHGGKGIFYWGAFGIDDEAFRQSLYALTSELAALQPLLTTDAVAGPRAATIDDLFDPEGRGVRVMLLRRDQDALLILVNEDNHRHLGVDVTGLESLDGRALSLLYGSEQHTVEEGSMVTRMQPYEVKLFSTHANRYESQRMLGRDYVSR